MLPKPGETFNDHAGCGAPATPRLWRFRARAAAAAAFSCLRRRGRGVFVAAPPRPWRFRGCAAAAVAFSWLRRRAAVPGEAGIR
jgi:hypothetical protein